MVSSDDFHLSVSSTLGLGIRSVPDNSPQIKIASRPILSSDGRW